MSAVLSRCAPASASIAAPAPWPVYHYVIPSHLAGRWLVVYRLPGTDAWEAPVLDCPTLAAATREADTLNNRHRPA